MTHTVFPLGYIRECIKTYISDKGKPPKLLVVSNIDFINYNITRTLGQYKQLRDIAPELEVTTGDYLDKGECDLALGIKDDD